ncbi:MAG: hypothetical protein AAGK22_09240 [Acidobacteriota bacterium]
MHHRISPFVTLASIFWFALCPASRAQDPELQPINLEASLSRQQVSLPGNAKNAAEHATLPHYLGTGKTIDGTGQQRDLPFRAYFASCAVETENPRMFVSLTLDDTSSGANADNPVVGSVFEARYDSETGRLEPTNNRAVLNHCNETHGIAASADCSKVAVLCSTAVGEPVSETYSDPFLDLVEISQADYRYTTQINNEHIIDAIPGLTQAERRARYKYNGEMWLLEWPGGAPFSDEPDKYVIHKGFGGGQPFGTPSLVFSDSDNSYGAAFPTSVFDTNHGGRHLSAALMVIERDGWRLNPNDRGWGWLCADGHVFTIRAFWNPYIVDERPGEFGALCTSDGNKYGGFLGGSVGVRHESGGSIFEGSISYLVPSNNSGVLAGGGHTLLPIDSQRSLGVLVGPEMHPYDHADFAAWIALTEQAAIDSLGEDEALAQGLTGLAACNWYADDKCLFDYMRYEHSGTFPLFNWGFWYRNSDVFNQDDLSKIGIFHTDNQRFGRNIAQADGDLVKWVAEDDDCMLGAPQLVDLQNGRFLLGYGKYQCISDGYHLRRFATRTVNTRSVAARVPSAYYLMEIDADGNALTLPTRVPDSGWGGLDAMVSLGEGRAAWAYVPSPELPASGVPDPKRATWELLVYRSNVFLAADDFESGDLSGWHSSAP